MNLFFRMSVVLLLGFVVFAFAGTDPWAFSVLQYGMFALALGYVFTTKTLYITRPLKIISSLLLFLIGLALVQSLFPRTLLDSVAFFPFTVLRLHTLEVASLLLTYLIWTWLIVQLFPSFTKSNRLILCTVFIGVAVVLCACALPKSDYMFRLVGIRSGFGPFLNRNHAGIFLAMSSVGVLSFLFASYIQNRKQLFAPQKQSFYMRHLCLLLIFVGLCSGTVFTRSRGGMLSLAVGIFTYSFLCFWVVPPKLKKRLKGWFFTLLALVLVSGWVATHVPEINAFAQRATNTSEMTRKMFYRSSFRALKESPYFGWGLGTTPLVIHNYFEWPIKKYVNHLHCDWLEILLEIGCLGAGVVLLFMGWLALFMLRNLKKLETKKQLVYSGLISVMTVMCVGSLFDFDFFIPANACLFFLTLGIACNPSFNKKTVQIISLNWIKRILLVGICVAAVWIPTSKTIAWRLMWLGKGMKHDTKIFAYEEAVSYYPSPRYAVYLGIAYYNAGIHSHNTELRYAYWRQAKRVAETYLKKYPKDKELSQLYMRVYNVD